MNRFLTPRRLGVLFALTFAVMMGGVLVLQRFWVEPGDRCEAEGKWYDIETRICAKPIYIPDITGRPAGTTRAEASAARNAELVQIERRIAAERHARDADADAQRRRLAETKGR